MDPVNYWHPKAVELFAASVANCVHDANGDIRLGIAGTAAPDCIPRVIHQIWLGGPVPKKLQRLISTWRATHPEWIHFLWTDANITGLNFYNSDAIAAATNYGEVSDIMRYEILYSIGGVYIDLDVQCVKSLNPLHNIDALYVGISNTPIFELNNAVLGAPPGHPLLAAMIQRIRHATGHSSSFTGFLKTIATTGPGMVTSVLVDELIAGRMHVNSGADNLEARSPAADVLDASSADIQARFQAATLQTYEKRQRSTSSCVLVLSSDCFYPLPNTCALEPAALVMPEELWSEVATRDAVFPFTEHLSGEIASYVTRCTYAVHFWAKTWQRPSAQIAEKTSTAAVTSHVGFTAHS